jgi:hypothetical protein
VYAAQSAIGETIGHDSGIGASGFHRCAFGIGAGRLFVRVREQQKHRSSADSIEQ